MGSDADQTLREGTITANLTKSEKCLEFLKNQTTDILNLNFVKEYVRVSFMIDAKGREEDVKDMLREQLEKAFNSVAGFEKISFIQLLEIDGKGIKNMHMTGDTKLHLIDFQILLKQGGKISYNTRLEDSIIQGLAIAARITARMLAIVHTVIYYPYTQANGGWS